MKRSGDVKWGEVKIGAVVVAAMLFLIWASLKGGDVNMYSSTKSFRVYFKDVKGLVVGAPVKLNGFEVGQVGDISFRDFERTRLVEVRADVSSGAWPHIRKDSQAGIVAIGFFGDHYLQVTAGDPSQPALKNRDEIAPMEVPDVMESLASKNGPLANMGDLVTRLDSITAATQRGEGSMGRVMKSPELHDQLVELAKDLRALAVHVDASQKQLTTSLVRVSSTMDSLGRALQGPGSVGRALRDPEPFEHFARASARLDSLTADISAGKGNIGKLTRDEALYRQTQDVLLEVKKMIQDMQANPKRYFKVSVF